MTSAAFYCADYLVLSDKGAQLSVIMSVIKLLIRPLNVSREGFRFYP